MNAKNIVLRILAIVGVLVIVIPEFLEFRESGSLVNPAKALCTLAALLALFASTFVSRIDNRRKANMKADFAKISECFGDDRRAKRYFYLGFRGWYAENHSLACQYLEKSAKAAKDPKAKARPLFYIGRCALEEKKYARAATYFEQAAALDHSYPDPISNLATTYFAMGEREKAKDACERGLLYCPRNIPMLTKLAKYHFDAGEYEEAFRLFQQAEQLNPGDPTLVMNMAVAYASLGNEQLAMQQFDRAKLLGYREREKALHMIQALLASYARAAQSYASGVSRASALEGEDEGCLSPGLSAFSDVQFQ